MLFSSTQSIILFVIYILTFVLSLIASIKNGSLGPFSVLFYGLYLLIAFVTAYDTDCLVSGGCIVWSWIRTVFYALTAIIVLILTFIGLVGSFASKDETNKKDESK